MDQLEEKHARLTQYIAGLQRVIVAFSGGVDSSLLLKVALDSLQERNVLAATVSSPLLPQRELEAAVDLAKKLHAPHRVIETDELQDAEISANPPDRCYFCKSHTFELLTGIARREGYRGVLVGTNKSDENDYRPGMKAARSFEMVKSPLLDCGINKEEVRRLAKALGLDNWNKPAAACLASRIPYGEALTSEKLNMIAQAEARLADLGLSQVRVRCHGSLARVEVGEGDLPKVLNTAMLRLLSREVKSCGFTYVALDADGYRTGSLNEVF